MMNQDVLEKPWYRWYALFILLMVYTSSHVDRQIMGILLEPIKMELNASDTQMGFLVGLTSRFFMQPWAYRLRCWQIVLTGAILLQSRRLYGQG